MGLDRKSTTPRSYKKGKPRSAERKLCQLLEESPAFNPKNITNLSPSYTMDKLSGLASKLGGGGNKESGSSSGGQQGEDYLDKGEFEHRRQATIGIANTNAGLALDSVEQKFGGGKVDPSKMRSTNEKITDTAREQFEKATGYGFPCSI